MEEAERQEARVQEAEGQEARVQEAEGQEARIQEAEGQEAGVQDAEGQDAGVQEARSQITRCSLATHLYVNKRIGKGLKNKQRSRQSVVAARHPVGAGCNGGARAMKTNNVC